MRFLFACFITVFFMISVTTIVLAGPGDLQKETAGHSCQPGYHWNNKFHECVSNCPAGYYWIGKTGKCLPVIQKQGGKGSGAAKK